MALDRTLPGLTPQARAEIDKHLAAYAKDPRSRAFAALAEAYRRAGMLDEAIKVAEEGLQVHPQLPSALVTLGRAYLQKGDLAKARPLLERVIAQSPENLLAQRALGELYFQAGESQLARQAFQALLRANPADPEAQARLKQLESPPAAPLGARVNPPAPAAPLGARVTPPAQSAAAPLSEKDRMDMFFESVDVTRSSPAPANSEYQVRPATEIFSDLEEDKRRNPITTETLARLLLKQGYADKARVIFEQILAADPSRQDLWPQITVLRQQLGLPPLPPPAPQPAPSLGAQPPQSFGARVTSPASSAAQSKTVPGKPPVWTIPEPAPEPEPAPAPKTPSAAPPLPPLGARVTPAQILGTQVPPVPTFGARVPPAQSLGARVTPPAQSPVMTSPPPRLGPPPKAEKAEKVEKVEALKEILGRIKKGNQP